jgi:hypothetical protein
MALLSGLWDRSNWRLLSADHTGRWEHFLPQLRHGSIFTISSVRMKDWEISSHSTMLRSIRWEISLQFLYCSVSFPGYSTQRSGTFLIDKQGIVRYIHQVTNPQASVEKEELMREVEQL